MDMVGGIPTHLKNMSASIGMIIPNIWENKTCSKPPTSTRWCWFITPISLGLMVDISTVNGIINQLITGGAPSCKRTHDSEYSIYDDKEICGFV